MSLSVVCAAFITAAVLLFVTSLASAAPTVYPTRYLGGWLPSAIAIDPVNPYIYLIHQQHRLIRVSLHNGTELASVNIIDSLLSYGRAVQDVTVATNGHIYISSYIGEFVIFMYEPNNLQRIQTIYFNPQIIYIGGMIIDSNNYLYIFGGQNMYTFDETGKQISFIHLNYLNTTSYIDRVAIQQDIIYIPIDNRVFKINTRGQLITSFPVNIFSYSIAVDTLLNIYLMTNDPSIYKYNDKGMLISILPLPPLAYQEYSFAIDSVMNWLYFTTFNSNTIGVMTSTGKRIDTYQSVQAPLPRPIGLAVDDDTYTLVVGDGFANAISRITRYGRLSDQWNVSDNYATSIALGNDGTIWIPDTLRRLNIGYVTAYNSNGTVRLTFNASFPSSIAFDVITQDRLYIILANTSINSTAGFVAVYDLTGTLITSWDPLIISIGYPATIKQSLKDGSIYIADTQNGQIIHASRDGHFINAYYTPGKSSPVSIDVDKHGFNYVCLGGYQSEYQFVAKYTESGSLLAEFHSDAIYETVYEGVTMFTSTLGADGTLYVSDSNYGHIIVWENADKVGRDQVDEV